MLRLSVAACQKAAGQPPRVPLPSDRALKRALKQLKRKERVLEREAHSASNWAKLFSQDRASAKSSTGAARGRDAMYDALKVLPRNARLESHLANLLLTESDPRAKLEFVTELLDSHLLSLASPVSKVWDPYDVKPQAFALNTSLALPVFTSVQYLRQFCDRFGFPVCDPSGVPWTLHHGSGERAGEIEAGQATAAAAEGDGPKGKRWTKSSEANLRSVKGFDIKQASPLQTYGPFALPHFVGYFGDIHTVLHNMAIVPSSVDLVVNPASPLEYVIAREIADKILQRADLVLPAFQRVEHALRAEFYVFFSQNCPEVLAAHSSCLPLPAVVEERGDAHEIVVVIDSEDWDLTLTRIREAKNAGQLVGHRALQLVPSHDAPPHLHEVARLFYDASVHGVAREAFLKEAQQWQQQQQQRAEAVQKQRHRRRMNYGFFQTGPVQEQSPNTNEDAEADGTEGDISGAAAQADQQVRRPPPGPMGFRVVGAPVSIQTAVPTDSFYSDPSMVYTEPWALQQQVKGGS